MKMEGNQWVEWQRRLGSEDQNWKKARIDCFVSVGSVLGEEGKTAHALNKLEEKKVGEVGA